MARLAALACAATLLGCAASPVLSPPIPATRIGDKLGNGNKIGNGNGNGNGDGNGDGAEGLGAHALRGIIAAQTIAPRPAFPEGWTRGALASAPLPSERRASFETAGPLFPLAPEPLVLADLPLIEVTPVDPAHPPPPPVAGEPSREIYVAPGCAYVTVRDHSFGFIRVGGETQPIGPRRGGGVELGNVHGGNGHDTYTFSEWETIERGDDGSLRFEETDAWFDMLTCKAYELRKLKVAARPIAGGLVYGFRTVCPSCEAKDRHQLHLLIPEDISWLNLGGFGHQVIAFGPGAADTRVWTFRTGEIGRFHAGGAVTTRTDDARFTVEVVQGTGEAEPTAFFSVTDAVPRR